MFTAYRFSIVTSYILVRSYNTILQMAGNSLTHTHVHTLFPLFSYHHANNVHHAHLNHFKIVISFYEHVLLVLELSVSLFLFRYGHLDVVQYLVDGGHCQPNSKDNGGWTPLHEAAMYVHKSVY